MCCHSSSTLTKVVMRPRSWESPKPMLRKCHSRLAGQHSCVFQKNQSGITDSSPSLSFPHSLTNEQSRQNWEIYGNPDGPGGEWCCCESHSVFFPVFFHVDIVSVPHIGESWLLNNGRWNTAAHSFQWELTPMEVSITFTHTSAVGACDVWSQGTKNNMFRQVSLASKNGWWGLISNANFVHDAFVVSLSSYQLWYCTACLDCRPEELDAGIYLLILITE